MRALCQLMDDGGESSGEAQSEGAAGGGSEAERGAQRERAKRTSEGWRGGIGEIRRFITRIHLRR